MKLKIESTLANTLRDRSVTEVGGVPIKRLPARTATGGGSKQRQSRHTSVELQGVGA